MSEKTGISRRSFAKIVAGIVPASFLLGSKATSQRVEVYNDPNIIFGEDKQIGAYYGSNKVITFINKRDFTVVVGNVDRSANVGELLVYDMPSHRWKRICS